MKPITLQLIGPVTVTGPLAQDLTPRSMKGRGLLSIVGVSRGLKQSRARLQDLLYSDRGSEQGSASIRQLLREIRQSFADSRDALITGPGWVGLDEGLVAVDVQPRLGVDGRPLEFAADLDIADPEFEDWLRDTRMHFESEATTGTMAAEVAIPTAPMPPKLSVHSVQAVDPDVAIFVEMILMEAAVRASDITPLIVIQPDGAASTVGAQADLGLSARAVRLGDEVVISIALSHAQSARNIWSQQFHVGIKDNLANMHHRASDISLAVLKAVEVTASQEAHTRFPLADIFSYSPDRLRAADRVLGETYDELRPGIALALRAFIRNTMLLERLAADPQQARAEADELSRKALELSPNNATVLGIGALVAASDDRFELEERLARLAIRADPLNPLAMLAQSQMMSDTNRNREAGEIATRGIESALSALNPATWQLRRSVAAFREGDLDDAQRQFAATHQLAPENRPALRFLAALLYHKGDHEGAREALLKLKRVEPDFSLDLMGSDDYPVDSLRIAGLLGITKSGLI